MNNISETTITRENAIQAILRDVSEQISELLGKPVLVTYRAIPHRASNEQKIVNEAVNICAEIYDLTPDSLMTTSRKNSQAEARHIAIWLIKKYTSLTYKAMGKHFGGRDHSTAINSCHKCEDYIATDKNFQSNAMRAEELLKEFISQL